MATILGRCCRCSTKRWPPPGQGRPVMFLMDTQMGFGVDFMMGSHKWHGVAPNDGQLATALQQLAVETAGNY